MTVFEVKATVPDQKVTLLPPKATVSAVLPLDRVRRVNTPARQPRDGPKKRGAPRRAPGRHGGCRSHPRPSRAMVSATWSCTLALVWAWHWRCAVEGVKRPVRTSSIPQAERAALSMRRSSFCWPARVDRSRSEYLTLTLVPAAAGAARAVAAPKAAAARIAELPHEESPRWGSRHGAARDCMAAP